MMAQHRGSSGGLSGAVASLAGRKPFDSNKHRRGGGGRFANQGGGAQSGGGRRSGGVAQAHAIFDKLHGHTRSEKLAAAAAAGINTNTARTQLYHWQRARAQAALGNTANPTREQLQAAAATALGVKPARAPTPSPKPAATPSQPPAAATHAPRPDPAQFQLRDGERHTHAVHRLATQMMGRPRSEVIATAVAAGINRNTAGTQYSHWARAQRQVVAAAPDKDPVDALEAALRRGGHMDAHDAVHAPAPARTTPVTAYRVGGPVRADVRRRSTTARPVPAPVAAPSPPAASTRALITDNTPEHMLPAKGTPAREMHDDLHRAASLFPGTTFEARYANGKITMFSVRGGGVNITREFSHSDNSVEHAYFQIPQSHRGSGAAKGFLAETVKSYQKHGIKKVKVHANIDVGGYAWVRYGFKPTKSSEVVLFNHVVRNVEHRQRAGALSKEAGDEIIKMARENRFNDIAKINTPVPHYDGSSSPLGRNLFLNTNWYGALDLKNKKQMDTFFKYAGVQ